MEERDKYRKQLSRRYEQREEEMKVLKTQLQKLEARNKKLENELMEKDELMHNLFSYIQSNS